LGQLPLVDEKRSTAMMRHLTTNYFKELQEDRTISKSVKFALKQYHAVNELYQILNASQTDVEQSLKQFNVAWEKYSDILEPKQVYSGHGKTFLKMAATILSLGAAAPLLWKKDEQRLANRAGSFFHHKTSGAPQTPTDKNSPDEPNTPSSTSI